MALYRTREAVSEPLGDPGWEALMAFDARSRHPYPRLPGPGVLASCRADAWPEAGKRAFLSCLRI